MSVFSWKVCIEHPIESYIGSEGMISIIAIVVNLKHWRTAPSQFRSASG